MNTSSNVGKIGTEKRKTAILFWTGLFLICVFVWVSCDAELVCVCVSLHCVVFHGGGSGGRGGPSGVVWIGWWPIRFPQAWGVVGGCTSGSRIVP